MAQLKKPHTSPATLDAYLNFDRLPDAAQVDQKVVQALFNCSATSVWRWVRNGTLPQPRRHGRTTRWRVGDLRAVLNGKKDRD